MIGQGFLHNDHAKGASGPFSAAAGAFCISITHAGHRTAAIGTIRPTAEPTPADTMPTTW